MCAITTGCNFESESEETQEDSAPELNSIVRHEFGYSENNNFKDCKSIIYEMEFHKEIISFTLPEICSEFYFDKGDPSPERSNKYDQIINPELIYYQDI